MWRKGQRSTPLNAQVRASPEPSVTEQTERTAVPKTSYPIHHSVLHTACRLLIVACRETHRNPACSAFASKRRQPTVQAACAAPSCHRPHIRCCCCSSHAPTAHALMPTNPTATTRLLQEATTHPGRLYTPHGASQPQPCGQKAAAATYAAWKGMVTPGASCLRYCSAWLSNTICWNSSPSMFSFSISTAAVLCRMSMLLWIRSLARLTGWLCVCVCVCACEQDRWKPGRQAETGQNSRRVNRCI